MKLTADDVDKNTLDILVGLLYHHYPKARDVLIRYESITREAPFAAITEVRDFIDHMHLCLDPGNDQEKKRDHLVQAEEHLRRSIAEPYQALGLFDVLDG